MPLLISHMHALTSSECTSGYYGDDCNKECGRCAGNVMCDSHLGNCPGECLGNWQKPKCNSK